ncbi:hypothetical protein CHS0354_005328 [Potamilus streckersoni]|uniref:Large ribosomal subunit protein bL32m n=1 Tax=Potamilus streckersoni TaxID=2493646 RepID=A0AAE0VVB6_9BIVA|nr:hypothetical protein CHS0354_005328 [Potamilus streckersoni]
MAVTLIGRLGNLLHKLETLVHRIRVQDSLNRGLPTLGVPNFDLGLDGVNSDLESRLKQQKNSESGSSRSVIDSIFGSILWGVPKSRRTLEKRLTRKFQGKEFKEVTAIKKNIVACLECGTYHEMHTICPKCYGKVREETAAMKAAMGEDFQYNHPRSEVVYLYEDDQEDRAKYKGKYIVEMKKPRPLWFAKNLLTKGHG